MSPWSLKRKATYIGAFALMVVVVVGIILAQVLKRTPTCFDGVQNGDEQGIDCGGSCARICEGGARSLVPLWERPFLITDNVYSVVAYFENQNAQAGIRRIPYRFRIYDAQNILISEQTGSTFIGPNQRSAIFETGIQAGSRIPSLVFFEFLERPVWERVDAVWSTPRIIVKNRNLDLSGSTPRLSATLANTALVPLFDIHAVALLYDAAGNAVYASQTRIDRIAEQGEVPVVFTWPVPFDTTIARIEIIPRIDLFSPRNTR
ncbi:MAG: hypothetical protein LRY41_00875 [Candidatus Pacebacteria bacterium]|nr:hypothetical protein [Candidatus Paceibacterota bacterium]MCD8507965.1 hypothetical protein [Candidatus Paceibacterota bacterium]MCD8527874.1 hypothetical protein [Candidatus Paceibacterota bacterium]MCD8564012.1 hypothetical protein [Candidatus Paceibacterota bacterium]